MEKKKNVYLHFYLVLSAIKIKYPLIYVYSKKELNLKIYKSKCVFCIMKVIKTGFMSFSPTYFVYERGG